MRTESARATIAFLAVAAWLTSSRATAQAESLSLGELAWRVELFHLEDNSQVDAILDKYVEANIAPAPLAKPVVVGDTVIVRRAARVLGVDLKSGKRIWQYPFNIPPSVQPPNRTTALKRQAQLRERIWGDLVYHDFTTIDDGVLLIHDEGFIGLDTGARRRSRTDRGPRLKQDFNDLMAFSISRQGYLKWRLGRSGDEPKLKDALFLCSPVADGQTLYCLAHIENKIRLLAIESATRRLAWQLPIYTETSLPDDFRRLHGAKLAVSDGIAVCPTVDGVVVAVDLHRRKLLWSSEYPSWKRLGASLSIDPQPIVLRDRIVIMPPDSLRVFCLDRTTGVKLWVADRDEHLFVAAATDENLLLASGDSISAWNMVTGAKVWNSNVVKAGFVIGKGIVLGGSYYVPTSEFELVRIALDTGVIVERIKTQEVLGNLLFHDDSIIACNAKQLVRINAEYRE